METTLNTSIFDRKTNNQKLKLDKPSGSSNVYKFKVLDIENKEISLSSYKGKVLLIVNVASNCGFTPQYDSLEKIYKAYNSRGLEILAFPCNDFGAQEKGSNEEIKNFCLLKYNITFKLFDKIIIKGHPKSPLFDLLTNNDATGKSPIIWNFEKFLIDKNGNIIKRFRSITKPDGKKITSSIEELLAG